jgi:hypothetical protein
MATIVQSTVQSTHRPKTRTRRDEAGAASAEYAVVTAAGVGIGGILIKLLTSEYGQQLLKMLLDFFLGSVGIA